MDEFGETRVNQIYTTCFNGGCGLTQCRGVGMVMVVWQSKVKVLCGGKDFCTHFSPKCTVSRVS